MRVEISKGIRGDTCILHDMITNRKRKRYVLYMIHDYHGVINNLSSLRDNDYYIDYQTNNIRRARKKLKELYSFLKKETMFSYCEMLDTRTDTVYYPNEK